MLSIDLGSTSGQFIDWQAVQNALLKGETISVKQSGKEIGQFLPNIAKPMPKKRQLGFMIGEGVVPDDIHWGDDEIMAMFEESFDENIE
ncbi:MULTISPECIES: hypothetical protein [Moraxella]|uniref:Type II toxin-antitoxin system prevent-host-death family antitoxin n=1 Tax=Moraxella lacunata TaxID=477 RepID=A0A1B8Q5K5_MORLA|nr:MULTISPECIES: hypothetical protein [Moraxella]MBE9577633.1 hypothetical protein [Moraxella sp. K1664]MBE9587109.1 hypothetical protein [Moraxella sp. K1630]MBE9590432.1 hypothetical protein [Moraxella sp. K127]MBE9595347.1 hypothetical protein [Moraxella sp. K2450]MDH9217682.1 hypothetical protein [Moraxella lacunata]